MEAILQRQTVNLRQDLMILVVTIMITFTLAGYWFATTPHYLSISKIEEGTIVQRDDSTLTIIIPDKR